MLWRIRDLQRELDDLVESGADRERIGQAKEAARRLYDLLRQEHSALPPTEREQRGDPRR